MEAAFAACGVPCPARPAIRRAVGLSLPQAIRALLPDADAGLNAALTEGYKLAFRTARADGTLHEPLFEGIRAVLDDLRARGWLLGVATGKSDRGLVHCLQSHGLTDHFITLQTADRNPSKPHPAMLEAALAEAGVGAADAVMIGDTAYDMAFAGNAGVRAIGVAWGYHEPHELLAAGAEWVAETPAELGDYLR